MSRTFSLFRLMLGITAVCLLCGLAVNFPEEATDIAFGSVFWAPTVIVLLSMLLFSKYPVVLSVACFVGALVGRLIVPLVFTALGVRGPWSLGRAQDVDLIATVIGPPLGALLLGGTLLFDELRHRRRGEP